MILIFSIHGDPSTNEVVDWLQFNEKEVHRINSIRELQSFFQTQWNIGGKENSIEKEFENIKSIWYRRRPFPSLGLKIVDNIVTNEDINYFYESEQHALFTSFCEFLAKKKWLSHYSNSRINKIFQLISAQKVGLNIPQTKIITAKKDLINLVKQKKVIIKPIQDTSFIHIDNKAYLQYTNQLSLSLINRLSDTIFPCLTQELINKNLEIRSFFIDNKIYSMAICSSFDKQTSLDFRRYNHAHPNRKVPYKLPLIIEEKLISLMAILKLNTGSIDIILDQYGEYYFLEVNPVGQFGMISKPCNYNLEKIIAEYLGTE